jgi:hypothetical protein
MTKNKLLNNKAIKVTIIIVSFGMLALAINTIQTGYKCLKGQEVLVDAHGGWFASE